MATATTLQGFLHPKKTETLKLVVSDRFCDESGEPLSWEIRALNGDELLKIQTACMGKDANLSPLFNAEDFQKQVVAAAVVTPNPNAADLLSAYGALTAVDLFGKMLTASEYMTLMTAVMKLNRLDKDITTLIDNAKN